MNGDNHPTKFEECAKKDVVDAEISHLKDTIEHNQAEILRRKEEVLKEINYKHGVNKQLTIWLGVIAFSLIGFMYNELNMLKNTVSTHTGELWHTGANLLAQNVDQLMCKVFGAC